MNKRNFWFERGGYVEPLETDGRIIVVADPSKSNSAILIGTTTGMIYDILELSGNDREFYGDVTGDTTVYCLETEEYLTKYLRHTKVENLFAEATISKQYKKKGKFYSSNHKTSVVLQEVRAAYTRLALQLSDKALEEVNNKSWKAGVLPDGYRGNDEKGSHRFWSEVDPFWATATDDVTDVYSIYVYLLQTKYKNEKVSCVKKEKKEKEFTSAILPYHLAVQSGAEEFTYSKNFNLEDNSVYYANRKKKAGYAVISTDDVEIEDIYRLGKRLNRSSKMCLIVVPNGGKS